MKILFVATVVQNHIMEFHIPYLKMLKGMGWEISVAAGNDYDNPKDCSIPYCDHFFDIPFERSPLRRDNITAYRMLKKIINDGNYDVIHCHTPVGGVLTRISCGRARKKGTKVLYTAHGFHFYKGGPLLNWIIYYPVERLLAHRTDVLITINKEDYKCAKRFKAGKVKHIYGVGVDLARFDRKTNNGSNVRRQLGIPDDAKVILSVGDLNENKNHKVMLCAMRSLPNVWYVICGRGPLKEEYQQYAKEHHIDDRLILAGYRDDIADYYRTADAFVFPSRREGLPVALMEAMASGVVCVAAYNRGTNELLPGSKLRFAYSDVDTLVKNVKKALYTDCASEIETNLDTIRKYRIQNPLRSMRKIYSSL